MPMLKPAPGKLVRDPDTFLMLPAEGAEVPDSFFWRRRLRDGDVVPVDETEQPPDGEA